MGERLKQIRRALGYTQEQMAALINDRSGKGSRASVSNWETDRTVEADVVRAYGELAEELGLAPKGSGVQWVVIGVVEDKGSGSDEELVADLSSIELFLRSQRGLSQRAKHQIREFYRRVVEDERREHAVHRIEDRASRP